MRNNTMTHKWCYDYCMGITVSIYHIIVYSSRRYHIASLPGLANYVTSHGRIEREYSGSHILPRKNALPVME